MIEKIKQFLKTFGVHILIFGFIVFLLALAYQKIAYTYITAEFDELRPTKGAINVFYKGYKIGKVIFVKPNDDFTKTFMKIALFHKKLKLPKNVSIKLQREKDKWRKIDYIEVIYPDEPVSLYLENGDLIYGKSTVDIETYLSSQESDSLDNMKEDIEGTITALRDLFTVLNETVSENRKNIKSATDSLSNAAKNIDDMAIKLNRSIKQQNLNKTMSNVETTTDSVSKSAKELEIISRNINEFTTGMNSTMPSITSGLNTTGILVKNINEITCGVANTLKKRFGGLRLLFGKVIGKECTNCEN